MNFRLIFLLFSLLLLQLTANAQDDSPAVRPTAEYTDADGTLQEVTSIDDGEAPLEVTFRANPQNMGEHTPAYEWHFKKQGRAGELLVRYEAETTYRFTESGTFDVTLVTNLTDTNTQVGDSVTITVVISESRLEFPNAFSPNGDGINDEYKAKDNYRSIVEFKAYIFNRWGQKLFDWDDPAKGWDGKFRGSDVKEGVYFVVVKAKGADGRVYNIKKDVNLLRGYTEGTSTTETR